MTHPAVADRHFPHFCHAALPAGSSTGSLKSGPACAEKLAESQSVRMIARIQTLARIICSTFVPFTAWARPNMTTRKSKIARLPFNIRECTAQSAYIRRRRRGALTAEPFRRGAGGRQGKGRAWRAEPQPLRRFRGWSVLPLFASSVQRPATRHKANILRHLREEIAIRVG